MSRGTPCSSQLIWCETHVEKLQQQLSAEIEKRWEGNRLSSEEARQELATETKNKQQFERDWLACCDKLNDERRIHLELEETLVKKLEAAQAREKVRLDAINFLLVAAIPMSRQQEEVWPMLRKAVDIPSDDTALKAALAAERERCAKVCDKRRRTVSTGNGTSYPSFDPASVEAGYCADNIRALGD